MTGDEICRELDRLAKDRASLKELSTRAVECLHESHSRFHWSGIYHLTPQKFLRLGPYVGAATDHISIPIGKGICGTAVAENRNLNIPDVTKVKNYLACSSETRSELVVLIRDGGKIFGQIDIDSHEPGPFDEATVALVAQVADWLGQAYARALEDGGTPPAYYEPLES